MPLEVTSGPNCKRLPLLAQWITALWQWGQRLGFDSSIANGFYGSQDIFLRFALSHRDPGWESANQYNYNSLPGNQPKYIGVLTLAIF